MTDVDLHRLIIKMLMKRVLEEHFISVKIKGGTNHVSVYLGVGKKHEEL